MLNNLNYVGSAYSVNWLAVLFSFSVLQWGLISYLVWKNYKTLYSTKSLGAFLTSYKFKKYIGFKDDLFFWFWNLYPIVFYLHFFYLESSWSKWMERLIILDPDNKISQLQQNMFHSSTSLYVEIAIILFAIGVATYFGIIMQNKKHDQFFIDKEVIYWWSPIVNKKIYFIRLVFLFTNLVLIGFLTYMMLKISIFIMGISSFQNLTIIPLHPDGNGGLKVISEILAIIIAMYLLRAAMGVIGLDDHKKQGIAHKIGDLYNALYLPLAIILSFVIYNKLKFLFSESFDKYNFNHKLSATQYQDLKDSILLSINNSGENLKEHLEKLNEINSILANTEFTLDLSLFYNTIFSITAPVSIWFIVGYFNKRLTETDA